MLTTLEIANAIGRKKMAEALGVGLTAVSNAVVAGKFPATWFVQLSNMCREKGIKIDPALFGMKPTVGVIRVPTSASTQAPRPKKVNVPQAGDAA